MTTTRTADVVIIGGGVTGVSTAFHLTRRGVRDVIVVDKGTIASGGTGKSSACVRQHYSTAETCRMIRYSLDFFQHFAERADGASCGFRHTGYLLGVDDKMRKPMEASVSLQRSVGIDTRLVSPTEMRELEPRLRADDLVAGCYEPASGYCNPVETAQGFARAARAAGARIVEDSPVVGILLDGERVRGVRTRTGDILAPVVVNAAGLWGARVAAMAGVELPIQSHPLQALVSEVLDQVLDTVVMSNAVHVYVSQAHKGELVMGAGIDPYNSYAQRGSFHVIEEQMAAALELFPIFARARVLRTWAGIVDVCPDASPIVGPTPVENLFVNCGWGTGGFKGTPGSGWVYAWTLAHGEAHELNRPFALERFETGALIDEHGAAAVAH